MLCWLCQHKFCLPPLLFAIQKTLVCCKDKQKFIHFFISKVVKKVLLIPKELLRSTLWILVNFTSSSSPKKKLCKCQGLWNRKGHEVVIAKGQLNSEWKYEVIVSPKFPTKNYKDFCPGSLLEGRAEISLIFGWDLGELMTS